MESIITPKMEKLPRIIIPTKHNLSVCLGQGFEGTVYKYDNNTAIKLIDSDVHDSRNFTLTFEKIELLGRLQNDFACLPKKIVEYPDGTKAGYLMDLVHSNFKTRDFQELAESEELKKRLSYIIQASDKIKILHDLRVFLGDISGSNIMIDENENVRLIDTDNWMYEGYDFNVKSNRMRILNDCYAKVFHVKDNDCFVLALLAMEVIQGKIIFFEQSSDETFKNQIEKLPVDKETKTRLRYIFSDAPRKPYIGEILSSLSNDEEARLGRFYR